MLHPVRAWMDRPESRYTTSFFTIEDAKGVAIFAIPSYLLRVKEMASDESRRVENAKRMFEQLEFALAIWDERDGFTLSTLEVRFTPTILHCSMATLIGLSIRVRYMPPRFKRSVLSQIPRSSEHAVNRQLQDTHLRRFREQALAY
jgi:hypothetical protein